MQLSWGSNPDSITERLGDCFYLIPWASVSPSINRVQWKNGCEGLKIDRCLVVRLALASRSCAGLTGDKSPTRPTWTCMHSQGAQAGMHRRSGCPERSQEERVCTREQRRSTWEEEELAAEAPGGRGEWELPAGTCVQIFWGWGEGCRVLHGMQACEDPCGEQGRI